MNAVRSTRRYIVTGGPGSGKSTLIEALGKRGIPCYPEVSRALIRREASRPDGVMPWKNLPAFARLAFTEMLRQHDHASTVGAPCVFDRAVPDIFGYLRHGGHEIPEEFIAGHACCRYEPLVFILPPWEEIYVNDRERPQSYRESVELHDSIRKVYESLGYTLVEVPKLPVESRCRFLIDRFRNCEVRN